MAPEMTDGRDPESLHTWEHDPLDTTIQEPEDIEEPVVPDTLKASLAADAQEGPQEAPGSTQTTDPSQTSLATFNGHEALLRGFCEHLQRRLDRNVLDHHKSVMEAMGVIIAKVQEVMTSTVEHSEHAQYQFSDALLKLQEHGLQVRQDPYQATVQALAPQGYPLTIQIAKGSVQELITAIPALTTWLTEHGYTPLN